MTTSNATIAITAMLAGWNGMVAARTGEAGVAWISGLLLVALALLITARAWQLWKEASKP